MPIYSFHRVLDDGSRVELARTSLSDREGARDFAIDLAQNVLRGQDQDQQHVRSRILICDSDSNDIDIIVSESF